MHEIAIIIPCYNESQCLPKLIENINCVCESEQFSAHIYIANDASTQVLPEGFSFETFKSIYSVQQIDLTCNLGHQKAIALSLATLADLNISHPIIIMDADGEDRPEDIPILYERYQKQQHSIIVAKRSHRSEATWFKFFYMLYRALFCFLTGRSVSFGNFCLIPSQYLKRLSRSSDTWNHLAASIIKSKIPFEEVATKRGLRYVGQSRMNFISLVVHGLNAISVFSDFAFIRLLIVSLFFAALSAFSIFSILYIRLFTNFHLPGWASIVSIGLIIIFFQMILMTIVSSIFNLSMKAGVPAIPARMTSIFIDKVQPLHRL